MSKKELSKKRIIFMALMLLTGAIFTVIYLALTGNKPEIFTDVVIEYTSMLSSNKSAERTLIFILILLGIMAYTLYYFWSQRKYQLNEIMNNDPIKNCHKIILSFLGTLAIAYYFMFTYVNPILVVAILIAVTLFIIDKNLVLEGFVFEFTCTYMIYGIYRFYVFMGGEKSLNNVTVALIVALIFVMILMFNNKRLALLKASLIAQLLIPVILLIYLMTKYSYKNEWVNIALPRQINVLVIVLIIFFIAEVIIKIYKKWNQECRISELITFGTCVSIMAFNRFSGTGALIPTDMHHPYENIIGFSQVFELGQKLFSEYIPISGMYSIIQGAMFKLFGNGFMENYYVTQNLFYLCIVILIIALLWNQVDKEYILMISLLFLVTDYNRVAFILPIMLLLSMPQLMKKKNLWLVLWFLTSLFQGLYYPLFGAAVCIAFIPLGIYQIVSLVKTGELKRLVKTKKFWIGWVLSFILFIVTIPYLLGTLKQVAAMAGQTIYADGISRFGQYVPSWFFSYLNHYPFIRIALYDIFSFLIVSAFVWIAYALTLHGAEIKLEHHKISIKNKQVGFMMIAVAIAPIICYTSTTIRMDIDNIYARSEGIMFTGAVLLLVFANKYTKHVRTRCLLVAAAVFIPVAGNAVGFFSTDSKLSAYYTVPETYLYIKNDTVKRLGTCFVEQEVYSSIKTTEESFKNSDPKASYMGKPRLFGYFYLLNIKGDGPMELESTVKGYESTLGTVEHARRNRSIIGTNIDPYLNYYLYHWLLTSGEYIWSPERLEFIPNDGEYTKEQTRNANLNAGITRDGFDVGKSASSLGLSYSSIQNVMTKVDIGYTVEKSGNGADIFFSFPFHGDSADYMYVEFVNMANNYQYIMFNLSGSSEQEKGILAKYLMKKNYNPGMQVHIIWFDDKGDSHNMICTMSEGKLLIPLGAGNQWLLNEHASMRLVVMQDGQEIEMPAIDKIEYWKLQEIK